MSNPASFQVKDISRQAQEQAKGQQIPTQWRTPCIHKPEKGVQKWGVPQKGGSWHSHLSADPRVSDYLAFKEMAWSKLSLSIIRSKSESHSSYGIWKRMGSPKSLFLSLHLLIKMEALKQLSP